MTPEDVMAKSLKDPKKAFHGYLPHIERQMRYLEHLEDVFTKMTETTTVTGSIHTATASTRVE